MWFGSSLIFRAFILHYSRLSTSIPWIIPKSCPQPFMPQWPLPVSGSSVQQKPSKTKVTVHNTLILQASYDFHPFTALWKIIKNFYGAGIVSAVGKHPNWLRKPCCPLISLHVLRQKPSKFAAWEEQWASNKPWLRIWTVTAALICDQQQSRVFLGMLFFFISD